MKAQLLDNALLVAELGAFAVAHLLVQVIAMDA
jgi:hypothetical protein